MAYFFIFRKCISTFHISYHVDDFIYDTNNQVIIPSDDYVWVDIYGITHNMPHRDERPPLLDIHNGIINYYW